MVNKQASFILTFIPFFALFSMFALKPLAQSDDQNPKVYIVYLGERQYDDSKLTTQSHHDLLTTVLGSKEKSLESMVYSYKHGFSGFAAKLTKSHAQKLAEMPGVIKVFRSSIYKTQTTRSWDYLGLSSSPYPSSNLLHRAKMGDNVIIGIIDSGFWPESKSFSDKGLGPIPSRWKGTCEVGEQFNATNCNRKVIGARWFSKGFIAEYGNEKLAKEYSSPRDMNEHGTHTASTAAGSFVTNVSFHGQATGTVRGGAPLAHLAIYKVQLDDIGSSVDLLKAIDEAIHDGVDVLSLSIGGLLPLYPEFNIEENPIAIGSFHAVARGIHVVCSGGNEGPYQQSVGNTAPWILTVAASTMDRALLSSITLGDNTTYFGQSFFNSKKDLVTELISMGRCDKNLGNESSIIQFIRGKLV